MAVLALLIEMTLLMLLD